MTSIIWLLFKKKSLNLLKIYKPLYIEVNIDFYSHEEMFLAFKNDFNVSSLSFYMYIIIFIYIDFIYIMYVCVYINLTHTLFFIFYNSLLI